ncbi:MAG: chaperone modulator CbpM [Thiomonas sp.]|uniref:chaperone modulator CbpM n=1 Tax=Thiomonas sp. TaxID=2047785 RepID=UPI002A368BD1|nr:chaperone modulator CbpM [Thiomonas sp.]MDY0329560.1 chaperone modulator CbpM [Thiomonas sp.]
MSAITNANAVPLVGVVLEDQVDITVDQVCAICRVERTQIVHLVEEGVIDPLQPASPVAQWRFSGEALARARRALRLQRDLELNAAAAALVLDLLDEVAALRAALRR